jgi:hypothetical protein
VVLRLTAAVVVVAAAVDCVRVTVLGLDSLVLFGTVETDDATGMCGNREGHTIETDSTAATTTTNTTTVTHIASPSSSALSGQYTSAQLHSDIQLQELRSVFATTAAICSALWTQPDQTSDKNSGEWGALYCTVCSLLE